jgi:hypothetical protein
MLLLLKNEYLISQLAVFNSEVYIFLVALTKFAVNLFVLLLKL